MNGAGRGGGRQLKKKTKHPGCISILGWDVMAGGTLPALTIIKHTVCQRSLDPFYTVTYYIIWVKTIKVRTLIVISKKNLN